MNLLDKLFKRKLDEITKCIDNIEIQIEKVGEKFNKLKETSKIDLVREEIRSQIQELISMSESLGIHHSMTFCTERDDECDILKKRNLLTGNLLKNVDYLCEYKEGK